MLKSGQQFEALSLSISRICIIIDGVDQAKFRIPRVLVKTHALDKLLRPALHLQGAWCHGFGYHLAVSDADMRKDTNNNVEVIARLLSHIAVSHRGLPLGMHLQQDNTSRECKNSLILRFACKLVALGIFRWVTLAYLITGHTHENIDATFGQLTVKIAALEFDDDTTLINLLLQLLRQLGVDNDSRIASKAYKIDEAANWVEWWDELQLIFGQVTGPGAPHWFRVCLLQDLGEMRDGAAQTSVTLRSMPGMSAARQDDVVVVVKERMASRDVLQVIRVLSASKCAHLSQDHPKGVHPRRPGGEDVKRKVARTAKRLHSEGHLSDLALDYLVGWAEGTRRLRRRPASYAFLDHRWRRALVNPPVPLPAPREPRLVMVHVGGGHPVADAGEEDEAEPGPLVEGP
jgi:hypothetical protein